MRILGIDPGSRVAGYGVIDLNGSKMTYCASGCIRAKGETYLSRVKEIYQGFVEVIMHYQPNIAIIEKVFIDKNPDTALKLGQVRGLILAVTFEQNIPTNEYATRVVKKSVAGMGSADKKQIQFMVKKILKLSATPAEDAADALALAICHVYHGA